jgi:regulator of protease activity HflC (stomatin/prohibitin superfamily)
MVLTRDNVSVDVSAVAYFRVTDAVKSVVAIENVYTAMMPWDWIGILTIRSDDKNDNQGFHDKSPSVAGSHARLGRTSRHRSQPGAANTQDPA